MVARTCGVVSINNAIFAAAKLNQAQHIGIIGAGLAGCHSAAVLAKRGFKVTLIEREATIASKASGNLTGIIYPQFSPAHSAQLEFYQASYEYTLQHLRELLAGSDDVWQQCGMLQIASNSKEQARQNNLIKQLANHDGSWQSASGAVRWQALNKKRASEIAGIHINHDAIFYPEAGWVDPRQLCAKLVQHANIKVINHCQALSLNYDQGWQVHTANHTWQFDTLIICNAQDALSFKECQDLPLKTLRGQLSYIDAREDAPTLQTIISHKGYITPARAGRFVLGASFNIGDDSQALNPRDQLQNLADLQQFVPAAYKLLAAHAPLAGRVCFRAQTYDYLPMVGAIPDRDFYIKNYSQVLSGVRIKNLPAAQYLPNILVNLGHGSRGISHSSLCARLIADMLTGTASLLTSETMRQLHPARFLVRAIKRQQVSI